MAASLASYDVSRVSSVTHGNATLSWAVLPTAGWKDNILSVDSAQDVAAKAVLLGRAVLGEIRRLRGGGDEAVDLALGVWESIATRERIIEVATRELPAGLAVDIIARLQRDALIHLNDYLHIARTDARLIGSARALLTSAIGAVLRHS